MTDERLEAAFVESAGGRIFALLREPAPERRSGRCALFVPPFAEEMNKCRRQVTETAKALVANGRSALIVDLYGTGDSDGDFADATWDIWKANVGTAIEWAEGRGLAVDALVAARLGCALAAESLRDAGRSVETTVFWQPVESGAQLLTQFLRLRVAASLMEADRKETVEELRAKLEAGEALEVAGYALGPALAAEIGRAELSGSLHRGLGELRVLEVGRARDDDLSVASRRVLAAAETVGIETEGARVPGEPYWTSTEVVVNAELVALTAQGLGLRLAA